MNMEFCAPDKNFRRAKDLIRKALKESPDVIVLPEMWNTGFFPKENLVSLSDENGERTKLEMSALAKELSVNIIAGSVANVREGKVYNTSYVFDRSGKCICEYDKAHLFSPMGENDFFNQGDAAKTFEIDGVKCGVIICYDLRFPELSRKLALEGAEIIFLVAQWPDARIPHLLALAKARAIENQVFFAVCNSCATAEKTKFGGNSVIFNPWGEELAKAGESEETITAQCDMKISENIRKSINVFCDRRADIY